MIIQRVIKWAGRNQINGRCSFNNIRVKQQQQQQQQHHHHHHHHHHQENPLITQGAPTQPQLRHTSASTWCSGTKPDVVWMHKFPLIGVAAASSIFMAAQRDNKMHRAG
eukprot:734703-Amphidinium_carterae.1